MIFQGGRPVKELQEVRGQAGPTTGLRLEALDSCGKVTLCVGNPGHETPPWGGPRIQANERGEGVLEMPDRQKGPKPRAKRQVRRGRRHGRSGPRKRVTVFLSAPLLKKVNWLLIAHGRTLESCLEEALGEWLRQRQPEGPTARSQR
jgi:hypothetical protein